MFNLGYHPDGKQLCRKGAGNPGEHQQVLVPGMVSAQVQDFALLLAGLHEDPIIPFLLMRSVWVATQPSVVAATHRSFVLSAHLLRASNAPSSRSFMKMLSRTGPSIDPGVHHCYHMYCQCIHLI